MTALSPDVPGQLSETVKGQVVLLPCPFCGEVRASLNRPTTEFPRGSINCPGCLATMPGEIGGSDRERELVEAWNIRANDWRLIEEDEPPRGKKLLVWGGAGIRFGYLDEQDNWRASHHGPIRTPPTHWCDLPAAPVAP